MCLGFADVDADLDAAAPALSAKPKMLDVICRSTTAESSLTLPCLVCSKAINVLKQACITTSATDKLLQFSTQTSIWAVIADNIQR